MHHQKLPFDLVVGLDRSDSKLDLHYLDLSSAQEDSGSLSSSPEALEQWVNQLRKRFPEHRVAVVFERPANNLIAFLTRYEWMTLYPLNPVSLQKFRETFVLSRAKDDPTDARYLACLLAHHGTQFRPWKPDTAQTRLLQRLVADRRAVVNHRTALGNRLQALLKDYFPQALELIGQEVWRPLAPAFLRRWPTLQAVKRAKAQTVRSFYYAQGSRSERLIQQRLACLQHAVALTDDESILASYVLRLQLTVREIALATQTVQAYDRQIALVFSAHEDRALFENLPGAGSVLAPRLLASMGTDRSCYPSASHLQCASGIAPVTKASGKKRDVHRRYLCSEFFKQSFHEWAGLSRFHSPWAQAFYRMKAAQGTGHHAIVRALAYKWIRILWRCWQNHTPYQEGRYLAALRKAGSPIIAWMEISPSNP